MSLSREFVRRVLDIRVQHNALAVHNAAKRDATISAIRICGSVPAVRRSFVRSFRAGTGNAPRGAEIAPHARRSLYAARCCNRRTGDELMQLRYTAAT